MSDTHGPIWIVNIPTPPYPDERFDGVATIPPLDPNKATPEEMASEIAMLRMQVADWQFRYAGANDVAAAARLTVKEIETVLRGWPFPTVSPLPQLRALFALLAPPAPVWQAKEDEP